MHELDLSLPSACRLSSHRLSSTSSGLLNRIPAGFRTRHNQQLFRNVRHSIRLSRSVDRNSPKFMYFGQTIIHFTNIDIEARRDGDYYKTSESR